MPESCAARRRASSPAYPTVRHRSLCRAAGQFGLLGLTGKIAPAGRENASNRTKSCTCPGRTPHNQPGGSDSIESSTATSVCHSHSWRTDWQALEGDSKPFGFDDDRGEIRLFPEPENKIHHRAGCTLQSQRTSFAKRGRRRVGKKRGHHRVATSWVQQCCKQDRREGGLVEPAVHLRESLCGQPSLMVDSCLPRGSCMCRGPG